MPSGNFKMRRAAKILRSAASFAGGERKSKSGRRRNLFVQQTLTANQ
jgi:hypothetical protein